MEVSRFEQTRRGLGWGWGGSAHPRWVTAWGSKVSLSDSFPDRPYSLGGSKLVQLWGSRTHAAPGLSC